MKGFRVQEFKLKHNDSIYTIDFDGKYKNGKILLDLNTMMEIGVSVKSGDIDIISIKRLSDGKVFKVGERVGAMKDWFFEKNICLIDSINYNFSKEKLYFTVSQGKSKNDYYDLDSFQHTLEEFNNKDRSVKTSILTEAHKIINERSEEKERQYGPFSEGMERGAKIASAMTGKDISARDMYKCLIALKLSRESYSHKEDNLLDAVAYMGALHNYELESPIKEDFKLNLQKSSLDTLVKIKNILTKEWPKEEWLEFDTDLGISELIYNLKNNK